MLAGILMFSQAVTVLGASPESLGDPVLHLQFEDNVQDSSDANNDGTIVGTGYEYVSGVSKEGKAISLKGGTYINLGTDVSLHPQNITLSFWLKPETAMVDEHIITWNKVQYNSDGWYLASQQDKPLILSVGSGNSQPYEVVVSQDRNAFFPAGKWTHVVVTFDGGTKDVHFYRNGILQTSQIQTAISASAPGVINPTSDMKSIGFNGPSYNGGYMKAALDEFQLFGQVASASQVVALYEEFGEPVGDTLAAQDAAALALPTTTAVNLILPTVGRLGSAISWTSSHPDVIATNGAVTRQDTNVTVTLEASVSYAGSETVIRSFTVTVAAIGASTGGNLLQNSGIEGVSLYDDYLMNAGEKEVAYLLSMSSKKFLYEFYKVAGLTPPTDSGYGGWERSNATNFRGHFFGHYMSALAMSYAGSDDPEVKAALLQQISDAIYGLEECQDAYAATHPSSAGYVSAFRESILDQVQGTGTSDENVIVPWYNLHKVLAGMTHIYQYVDDPVIQAKALEVVTEFGEYIYNRVSALPNNARLLGTEYGGMNEALYVLYDLTGNDHIKYAAECFDEITLFQQLANGTDILQNKHANTMIPKLTGALKRYTTLTENPDYYAQLTDSEKSGLEMYRNAAENFWDIVTNHHTYVTGGNSQSEHFREANKLGFYATQRGVSGNGETCETCNTYNMLKLSRALFALTQDKKYADYYENTYTNAILSSQSPETGTTMYFQPMAPGYNKVYHRPHDEFWCCAGTGVESFSKLGDSIYFTKDKAVYVNMFFSSDFEYEQQNLKLTQTADMPNSDVVTFEVGAISGNALAEGTVLYLRQPDWLAGDVVLSVNGQVVAEPAVEKDYIVLTVSAGDVITYTMPMEVTTYDTPDDPNFIAFKYGPTVLSAGLGSYNISASEGTGILVRRGTLDSNAQTNIVILNDSVAQWKENITENMVRIEDSEEGKVQFQLRGTDSDDLIYTPHYRQHTERYGLYMFFEEPDSAAAQDRILANKLAQRELERSTDYLFSFDNNNYEFDKNLQTGGNSSVGTYSGRQYRHAQGSGSWFSYDFKLDQSSDKHYIAVTYYGGDGGRSFDLYLNNEKFKTVTITNANGSTAFYDEVDEIPAQYLTGETINVKFLSTGSIAGGVYGINIIKSRIYDTNSKLSALAFDVGTLSPAFEGSTLTYLLTVPDNTQTVRMNATPATGSGLVYIGNILIDDTSARTIRLTGGQTLLKLRSSAQDHTTFTNYSIRIVKEGEPIGTVDKTNLQALYDANVNRTNKGYTDESWTAFQNALSEVERVLGDSSAIQVEVDIVEADLNNALKNLIIMIELLNHTMATREDYDTVAAGYINRVTGRDSARNVTYDAANQAMNYTTDGLWTSSGFRYNITSLVSEYPVGTEFELSMDVNPTGSSVYFGLLYGSNTAADAGKVFNIPTGSFTNISTTVTLERNDTNVYFYSYCGNPTMMIRNIVLTTGSSYEEPEPVNKAALEALIASAGKLDSADYTPDSWTVLEEALAKATAIIASDDATQEDVDTAVNALQAAIDGLKTDPTPQPVEKGVLEALVVSVHELDEQEYTTDSWSALEEALVNANAVLEDADATQDTVDAAVTALQAAMANLKKLDPGQEIEVESIVIRGSSSVKRNNTTQLTAVINPANATIQDVTWTSLTPEVATVDEDGLLSATDKTGFAIIQVTAANGVFSQFTIRITA